MANERRPCVLVGRDNMALPASLISQIGYRCHPSLYTEGDPGEKVELVAGGLPDRCHGNRESVGSCDLLTPCGVFRFRCVHDTRSADELPPLCWRQTQGAAQEAAGHLLRQVRCYLRPTHLAARLEDWFTFTCQIYTATQGPPGPSHLSTSDHFVCLFLQTHQTHLLPNSL